MSAEESMVEVYIYETQQLLQRLDDVLLDGENRKILTEEQINEVFRSMHTIKGASAMMEFGTITTVSHAVEDIFSLIRESGAADDEWPAVFDLAFQTVSFINGEVAKLQEGIAPNGSVPELTERAHALLAGMKARREGGTAAPAPAAAAEETPNVAAAPAAAPAAVAEEPAVEETIEEETDDSIPFYKIKIAFAEDCQMETIRAMGAFRALSAIEGKAASIPEKLDTSETDRYIIENGFLIYIQTEVNPDILKGILDEVLFVEKYSILPIDGYDDEIPASIRLRDGSEPAVVPAAPAAAAPAAAPSAAPAAASVAAPAAASVAAPAAAPAAAPKKAADLPTENSAKQNFISVNVNKLDSLLDIVGEIVTAQSMVVSSATLDDKRQESFDVAAKQLRTLINELQDVVMSIRMLPVSNVFQKMKRIVRDMAKKENKDIELVLLGEETEVDKNVIDCLSDPLMHLIRNSVDHGIEDKDTRMRKGKPAKGRIVLEAHTTGNDVIVTITDDGKGLQRDAILKKAYEKGLVNKAENEISDKDVYSLIFLPGFSTKEAVTEYSGRGVGMDVVRRNVAEVGGSLTVDSEPGKGTTFTIRIPLTLTIVDGMKFQVGNISFIIPTSSVQTALKPNPGDVFVDSEGHEMMMLQGNCYSVIRMSDMFGIENAVQNPEDGMIMQLHSEGRDFCMMFDQLDGEYQVVAKSLPSYLEKCAERLEGISGCTILGDGSINLILDANKFQIDV